MENEGNGGSFIIPVQQVHKIAAEASAVSLCTVEKIKKEGRSTDVS
jgi:quercetin dioxygenase-like cupin family protein